MQLRTVTALFGLTLALPASAQTRPDSTARADTTAVVPLDPVVVTVSKLPLQAGSAGFAISVVPHARLAAERPLYAADALRALPGSFIDEALGPGGPTIIRLRGGEEVFTQILMDGVQVNENGGFFDFQGVSLTGFERIEIARGPQSAIYGSSAVSGVVNLITRPGQTGPLRFGGTLEGGGGTGDGRNFLASINASGGSSSVLYSAGGAVVYDRGIHDLPHDTWTRDASVRIDATPSARWRLKGVARFIGVESMHPVRDAGATRVPLDPNARLDRNRFLATTEARYLASGSLTHNLRASIFHQDFFFGDRADGIAQPEAFFVPDFTFDFDSRLTRTTLEYTGQLQTTGWTRVTGLRVAFGGLVEREDLATEQSGDFGDASADLDRASAAAFADVHATPHPRLSILAGARAERYEDVGTEWTPRASIVWSAHRRLAIRAAAGRAYKVPNLQEQYIDNAFIASNPDLEPETSVSWEIGADLTSGSGSRISITAFRQTFRNLIRTVAIPDDTRTQNRNVGRSRASGIEAALHTPITRVLSVGAEATRVWTRVGDNTGLPVEQYPVGEALPFRPDWTASTFLRAAPAPLDFLVRASWIGQQIVLSERFSGERVPIDGYLRIDTTVNFAIAPDRTLFLRVDNLLDTEYATAFDRPGRPLTAVVGFQLGR